MSKIKTHCEDCLRVLGKDFKSVHEWLDEYASKYNPSIYLEYHRKFRHHEKGVKEAKEKFGFYAEKAAKLHIIRDYEMYLLTPIMSNIREDQIDKYFEMLKGFFHKVE